MDVRRPGDSGARGLAPVRPTALGGRDAGDGSRWNTDEGRCEVETALGRIAHVRSRRLTIGVMRRARNAGLAACREQFVDLNGEGARLYGGRWNSPGRPMVYAAESAALALLEVAGAPRPAARQLPDDYVLLRLDLDDLRVETVDPSRLRPRPSAIAGSMSGGRRCCGRRRGSCRRVGTSCSIRATPMRRKPASAPCAGLPSTAACGCRFDRIGPGGDRRPRHAQKNHAQKKPTLSASSTAQVSRPPKPAPVSIAMRLLRTAGSGDRRVAVHDDHAEILLAGQEGLADAQQVLPRLPVERDARPDAGMAEQVAAGPVTEREAAQEGDEARRQRRQPRLARRRRIEAEAAPASPPRPRAASRWPPRGRRPERPARSARDRRSG